MPSCQALTVEQEEEFVRQMDNLFNKRLCTMGLDQRADAFNARKARICSRELEVQADMIEALLEDNARNGKWNSVIGSDAFMRAAFTGDVSACDSLRKLLRRAHSRTAPAVTGMNRAGHPEQREADGEGVGRGDAFEEREDEFDSDVQK